MITTEQALSACLALVEPCGQEEVPLAAAGGRVLAQPIAAKRDQPPFRASVMDGYALSDAAPGGRFRVVGEAPAGHGWAGTLGPGEALRIFTGAPLPDGADRVIIQEDVLHEGDTITLKGDLDPGPYIRAVGADFAAGETLEAPCRLTPARIALAAAMGHGRVTVSRRPDVAIMATGDELVPPGDAPAPDQIIASNSYGLQAMAGAAGADARLLPIARDDADSLKAAFWLAADADLIVTIGGASVGDHDLVGPVAAELGLERAFYKIAMRPGKPLMAGRLGRSALVGLPGNPVSSMICGQIFVLPMIEAFLSLPAGSAARQSATLTVPMGSNGPREHYMRAHLKNGAITPADSQDSALLSRLANANALLVRPPHDPEKAPGAEVSYIPLLA
ncbi:MAG: gephyrin-like molybdotransferase Glp [Pseudomonadota bacterium]